jgi:hypothetical protein
MVNPKEWWKRKRRLNKLNKSDKNQKQLEMQMK